MYAKLLCFLILCTSCATTAPLFEVEEGTIADGRYHDGNEWFSYPIPPSCKGRIQEDATDISSSLAFCDKHGNQIKIEVYNHVDDFLNVKDVFEKKIYKRILKRYPETVRLEEGTTPCGAYFVVLEAHLDHPLFSLASPCADNVLRGYLVFKENDKFVVLSYHLSGLEMQKLEDNENDIASNVLKRLRKIRCQLQFEQPLTCD